MQTSLLRYLLLVLLLVVVGGGWWLFSSRPPRPAGIQTPNPPAVSTAPAPPSPEKAAPPAPRSSALPAPRLTPPPVAAPSAVPSPEVEAPANAQNADALEEDEQVVDEDVDSLEARLAAIGFSVQDIERIMDIVFSPPAGAPTGEDESSESAEGIDAPGLEELADDFRKRFAAAGFSPKDIERILEIIIAPPEEVFPEEDEGMDEPQEPTLDDLVDDFQDRLLAAGFSPQNIERILQAILPPGPTGAATAPGHELIPAYLRDSLVAAGFSPKEVASILQTLLQPTNQQ